jgi:hypothetical protein
MAKPKIISLDKSDLESRKSLYLKRSMTETTISDLIRKKLGTIKNSSPVQEATQTYS